MTRTLEEAIGCWTTNLNYNSLPILTSIVKEAAGWCRKATLKSSPGVLRSELKILRGRLDAMIEVTDGAIKRCSEIIENNEVGLSK